MTTGQPTQRIAPASTSLMCSAPSGAWSATRIAAAEATT